MNVRVVADDLIWASRLDAAVKRAGAQPVRDGGDVVIVDLNGRAYDGIAAVAAAAESGRTVIAVGQHDDSATRKRALSAGARRVFSYNKMFSDGPQVVADLIAGKFAAQATGGHRPKAGSRPLRAQQRPAGRLRRKNLEAA